MTASSGRSVWGTGCSRSPGTVVAMGTAAVPGVSGGDVVRTGRSSCFPLGVLPGRRQPGRPSLFRTGLRYGERGGRAPRRTPRCPTGRAALSANPGAPGTTPLSRTDVSAASGREGSNGLPEVAKNAPSTRGHRPLAARWLVAALTRRFVSKMLSRQRFGATSRPVGTAP